MTIQATRKGLRRRTPIWLPTSVDLSTQVGDPVYGVAELRTSNCARDNLSNTGTTFRLGNGIKDERRAICLSGFATSLAGGFWRCFSHCSYLNVISS